MSLVYMCRLVDVVRRDHLGSIRLTHLASQIHSDTSGINDTISAASREKVAAGRHLTRNRNSMAAVREAGGAPIADVKSSGLRGHYLHAINSPTLERFSPCTPQHQDNVH